MLNIGKKSNNEYDYSGEKICYLFDSGFYGNHVKNAFNALSLPSGAVVIYKYNIDEQASLQSITEYNSKTKKKKANEDSVLLIIVDRHHRVDETPTHEMDEKTEKFDYWPFRYGKILSINKEADGYVYVYVKLLHYIQLANRGNVDYWIKNLRVNAMAPPTIESAESEKFCYLSKINTLEINSEGNPLFSKSDSLQRDTEIWVSEVAEFTKISFFKSVKPSDENNNRTQSLFFYRFYITKATRSAQIITPVIDSFYINECLSGKNVQCLQGFDCRYSFDIDKKYALILQCYFPRTKETGLEQSRVRIRIKLGEYAISDQVYSDNLSTQRIFFSINRRQFMDYSIGSLTIDVSPYKDSNESENIIICAPSTEMKFEIGKGILRRYIEPVVVAGLGAILLTGVEAVRELSNNIGLLGYMKNNVGNLLVSFVINFALMLPFVWFTKRDLLK
ncbi:MAG: hypothetical protein LBH58_01710 [Tannerellaceae bacterium]|jgi:hypothetical protein|nr:hypothetical protein [Tannerellaceae bacterium]